MHFQFEQTYTQLPDVFYAWTHPAPSPSAKLIVINDALAHSLGLDLADTPEQHMAEILVGHRIPNGAKTFAQAYSGHQYGHYTELGDGRAHLLGEHLTPAKTRFDVQLKGAGPTPYARRGDGRATLGPMLREYLISEAMHHLGIPTTRSLAVCTTGTTVRRQNIEPGAVLTRIAHSHIRFGTFEFANQQGFPALKALFQYTLQRHDPDLMEAQDPALRWFERVMSRTLTLIVEWMRVGFVHGVMNTDNMSVLGDGLDYGPCAFLDTYDPKSDFSAIDHQGRYAFNQQAEIAQWNLARLAEALWPLMMLEDPNAFERVHAMVQSFMPNYQDAWQTMMRHKLGLETSQDGDLQLIRQCLSLLQRYDLDYTLTFHTLGQSDAMPTSFQPHEPLQLWHQNWQKRLEKNPYAANIARQKMRTHNPVIIPRNHQVAQALKAAYENDFTPFHSLVDALTNPYQATEANQAFQIPPKAHERVTQTHCGT